VVEGKGRKGPRETVVAERFFVRGKKSLGRGEGMSTNKVYHIGRKDACL